MSKTVLSYLICTAGILVFSQNNINAQIDIQNQNNFIISWDGNKGDNFNQPVPDNLALASNGATAFASSEYGVVYDISYHLKSNLNDGIYGNNASWIGAVNGASAGVTLATPSFITSFAFGRDNGDLVVGESNQFTDRSIGTYTIDILGADNNWVTAGTITYLEAYILSDQLYLRHEYTITDSLLNPVQASAIRITTTATTHLLAIDEIEVYGSAIPEPSTYAAIMGTLSLLGLLYFRRRKIEDS